MRVEPSPRGREVEGDRGRCRSPPPTPGAMGEGPIRKGSLALSVRQRGQSRESQRQQKDEEEEEEEEEDREK